MSDLSAGIGRLNMDSDGTIPRPRMVEAATVDIGNDSPEKRSESIRVAIDRFAKMVQDYAAYGSTTGLTGSRVQSEFMTLRDQLREHGLVATGDQGIDTAVHTLTVENNKSPDAMGIILEWVNRLIAEIERGSHIAQVGIGEVSVNKVVAPPYIKPDRGFPSGLNM